MDGAEASSEGREAAAQGKRIHRQWTTKIKRRIVREAERPGAVKQQVAERHGVHVSVLNRWRTELPSGSSGGKKAARRVRLLPIRVSKTQASRALIAPVPAAIQIAAGAMIEVALPAGQRVTVRGVVDGDVLRTVLQELSRC